MTVAVMDPHKVFDLGSSVLALELHPLGPGAHRDAALLALAGAAELEAVLMHTVAVAVFNPSFASCPCTLAPLTYLETDRKYCYCMRC